MAAVLSIALSFQILILSNGFYAISADESGHTLQAYRWFLGENILHVWLPFHRIVLGFIFNFSSELFYTPRILSIIFGLFTIAALMYLSFQLFENKITALITGLLSSAFTPIIIFSVLPLLEIFYFFFVVISFAILIKIENTKTKNIPAKYLNKNFSLLSFLILVASSIRYDAWIFSFCFLIIYFYLLIRKEISLQAFLIFAFLSFAFILFWIIKWYFDFGSFFGFITASKSGYKSGSIFSEIKNNILFQFLTLNFFSLNIIGIITLITSFKAQRKFKFFTFIFLLSLLIMTLLSFFGKAMPSHNYWRIAAIWGILLIPFTANWLANFLSFTNDKSFFSKLTFTFLSILIFIFFTIQTIDKSKSSFITKNDLNAGKYLFSLIKKNEINIRKKILLDGSDWTYTTVLIASNRPDMFILNSEKNKDGSYVGVIDINKIKMDLENLKKMNIAYLVFKTEFLKKKIETDSSIKFLKKFNDWIIYSF